jgi:hypothetical protein
VLLVKEEGFYLNLLLQSKVVFWSYGIKKLRSVAERPTTPLLSDNKTKHLNISSSKD